MSPMNRAISAPCLKVVLLCLGDRRNDVPASVVTAVTHSHSTTPR
jgi:hypothetical protein